MNADRTAAAGGTYARLTSPGPAAIAVLRLTGPRVDDFLARHVQIRSAAPAAWPVGTLRRATLLDALAQPLDDILVTVLAAEPNWDVQLHLHGNPWLVRRCETALVEFGYSPAGVDAPPPWPADDLIDAEATALLPRVLTLRGAQWVLHQAALLRATIHSLLHDPDLSRVRSACQAIAARRHRTDWFTCPARVVLIGPTNAGKSTLANALADHAASVVSPQPGTTRDWVEIPGEADGHPVVWIDTAGVRPSHDPLERLGIARTRELLRSADALVVVLDRSGGEPPALAAFLSAHADLTPACVALNKLDQSPGQASDATAVYAALPPAWRARSVPISALQHVGLPALTAQLIAGIGRGSDQLLDPCAFTDMLTSALACAAQERDVNSIRAKLLQLASHRECAAP